MDLISIIIGFVGLLLGSVSIFLCVMFYLKPLIDKSLTMLNMLQQTMKQQGDTMKEQGELLKSINDKQNENSEDHVGIISSLTVIKEQIISETTERTVARMKEIIK